MLRTGKRPMLVMVCALAVPAGAAAAEQGVSAQDSPGAAERVSAPSVEPSGRVYEVTEPGPASADGGVELITGGSSEHGAARIGRMPVLE